MKAKQFHNKNQFIIEGDNKVVFQSYESTIAEYDYTSHTLTVHPDWNYSHTTLKHFYLFLDEYLSKLYNIIRFEKNRKKSFNKLLNTTQGFYNIIGV